MEGLTDPADRRLLVRQAGRFVVVGVLNTLTTVAIVWALRHLGMGVAAASAAGYAVGVLQGFLLSRGWTWSEEIHASGSGAKHAGAVRQLLGFVAINLLCGWIFTRLSVAFETPLGFPWSLLATVAITMVLSFGLNLILFRRR